MSEFQSTPPSDIDDYQEYVRIGRFPDDSSESWQRRRSDHVQGELMEFVSQHGVGANMMTPSQVWPSLRDAGVEMHRRLLHTENIRDLQDKMADEMGDMLWFLTDIEDRRGESMLYHINKRLRDYSGDESINVTSFSELDERVMEHAQAIDIPGVFAKYDPKSTDRTSVAEHPALVYFKFGERVVQRLVRPGFDMTPGSRVTPQPAQDIDAAVADMALALTYIAHDRLETTIHTVAAFNIAKLDNRALHNFDKSKDISFTDFREQFSIL